MPLILPGNVGSATASTGYNVANSVRFNDGDSPRLVIANPTAGVRTKGTFSTWFKRTTLGANQYLFSTWNNATSGYSSSIILLQSDDRIQIANYVASGASGGSGLIAERKFRDPSAWYHVVFAWDTTDSTAADRYKIYVNGTRQTVFNGTPAYPTENQELFFQIGGTANPQHIGYESTGSDTKYFDGYLAETVYVEGSALAADSFGEFDSDSPTIWKPKDVSGLTFGNEGFYLDYEDSGDLGDDESGNGNDFAETNLAATDQSTDTCTNNFCTLNSIFGIGRQDQLTYSEGNTVVVSGATSGSDTTSSSTFALNSGKWYAEFKLTDDADGVYVGVAESNFAFTNSGVDASAYANIWLVRGDDGTRRNNDNNAYVGSAFSNNDIISIAIDMDNSKIWWSVNGTYPNSGDPAAGSNAAFTNLSGELMIIVGDNYSSKTPTIKANFGSPPYTISSGNTDGNGYGNFEYAVPSGYYALNTKNLAEFG